MCAFEPSGTIGFWKAPYNLSPSSAYRFRFVRLSAPTQNHTSFDAPAEKRSFQRPNGASPLVALSKKEACTKEADTLTESLTTPQEFIALAT